MPEIQIPDLSLFPILPELILVGTAIFVLLFDAVRPSRDQRPVAAFATLAILGAAMAAIVQLTGPPPPGGPPCCRGWWPPTTSPCTSGWWC